MSECQFCKVKSVMRKIVKLIDEELEEKYGFYIDDYIDDVYAAAIDAEGAPTCDCEYEETGVPAGEG